MPADLPFVQAIAAWLDLDHQEFVILATALALLGFSVVAAILLMRTRIRAARNEARLRSELGDLQVQADRLRALLFAEPQILISWAAGDNRPQISGDTSLLLAQESPQRILAFGTWLPPEPALQMDHAVDALREAGEGFLLNLTTSNGQRAGGDGPRHRRPGRCADSRTRRVAPRTGGNQSAPQGAAGRNRAAARLRRRGALADLGQGRQGRPQLTPIPPMRGRPRPAASPTRSSATSNCSTAATAATWTGR